MTPTRTVPHAFAFAALLAMPGLLGACQTPEGKKFSGFVSEMCACADEGCAKEVHGRFTTEWEKTKNDKDIDWASDRGERIKNELKAANKDYNTCLNKQTSSDKATETCQADDKAKGSSDACKACCLGEGRYFKSWSDPMLGGALGALGGESLKGCNCS